MMCHLLYYMLAFTFFLMKAIFVYLLTLHLCVHWILSRDNFVYFYMPWVLRTIKWDSGYVSPSSLLCPCSSASWTGAWLCLWMPFSTLCPRQSWRSCTHPGLPYWIIYTGWVSSKPWEHTVNLHIKNYQNVIIYVFVPSEKDLWKVKYSKRNE